MRASIRPIIVRALLFGAMGVCLFPLLRLVSTFVHVLATRVAYPMDIEWLESGQIYHAYRFLHGLPIYGPPAQGFVPYPYPPGYFVTVALVGALTRLDWWTARGVSDFFVALVVVLQVGELWRHVRPRALAVSLAVVAVAGLALGYKVLQGSYDLARPDFESLGLACLAAALVPRARIAWRRAIAISFVLFASIYTKQTSIVFVVWIVVFVSFDDRRGAARIALVTAAMCSAVLAALAWKTDGWFVRWIMSMRHHPIVWPKTFSAITLVREAAPLLPAFPLAALLLWWARALRSRTVLWLGMLAASAPASLVPYASWGGWLNCLTPTVALAWFVGGMLVADAVEAIAQRTWAVTAAHVAILAASWAFFSRVVWDGSELIVDDQRRRDAEAFHAFVRSIDGTLAVPSVPFAPVRDGHSVNQISLIAYYDAYQRGAGIECDPSAGLADTRADWVLLVGVSAEDPWANGIPGYARARDVDLAFAPMIEGATRPKTLWRRMR